MTAPEPVGLADGGWQRLDPRWLAMARTRALIRVAVWVVLLGGAVLAFVMLGDPGPTAMRFLVGGAVVPVGLVATVSVVVPPIRYRHGAWRVTADGVSLRWGAWWRSEQRVPRSRIQHTDVAQGPLERRHGLARLIVHTAGMHHGELVVPGLDHADALALRDALLRHDDTDAPV